MMSFPRYFGSAVFGRVGGEFWMNEDYELVVMFWDRG